MIPTMKQRETSTELWLFLVVIVWAANYPVTKFGISGLDIFVFNGLRFVTAAVLLVLFFRVRSSWTPVTSADWPRLIRAGFIANVLYQIAFIIGINLTTAGNAAVLLATAPLWTVFINARLNHEPIPLRRWTGMSVALAGIVVIIAGSGKVLDFGRKAILGDLICVGAASLWATNTTLQKSLLERYSAMQLTVVMISVGAIGLAAAAVPTGLTLDWGAVRWTYYVAAFGSGALSIGAASVLWSVGVKRLGPGRTANFGNLTPVLALVISALTLNEPVFPLQLAGVAVTLTGVWVAAR